MILFFNQFDQFELINKLVYMNISLFTLHSFRSDAIKNSKTVQNIIYKILFFLNNFDEILSKNFLIDVEGHSEHLKIRPGTAVTTK